MASNGTDDETGYPLFPESDAPQQGADLQEVGKYASKVGTRLIGTAAQMNAYEYARPGLLWHNTDNGYEYLYGASGWTLDPMSIQYGRTVLTAVNGWTAGTGVNTPFLVREGSLVTYAGGVSGGTGGSYAFTIPAWARPDRLKTIVLRGVSGWVVAEVDSNGSFRPGGNVVGSATATWSVA